MLTFRKIKSPRITPKIFTHLQIWKLSNRAYANAGDLETARTFFEKMPCRNAVTLNLMISSLC